MPEAPAPDPAAFDPAGLAALHARVFTTPRPWSVGEITSLLESPHVFLCREDGGFLMGRALAGEAELLTLAVAPEVRRRGIGRRLVEAFLQEARARGAETAFLEVSAENAAAVALYDSAGFRLAGRRRGYYATPEGRRIDALVMGRDILSRNAEAPG